MVRSLNDLKNIAIEDYVKGDLGVFLESRIKVHYLGCTELECECKLQLEGREQCFDDAANQNNRMKLLDEILVSELRRKKFKDSDEC